MKIRTLCLAAIALTLLENASNADHIAGKEGILIDHEGVCHGKIEDRSPEPKYTEFQFWCEDSIGKSMFTLLKTAYLTKLKPRLDIEEIDGTSFLRGIAIFAE